MTITVTTADAAENLDRAGGRVMRLLVDADATGQRLSVLSCEAPAGEAGPPLHVHPGTAEREAGRAFGPAEIMPIAARHDWSFAGPPLLPSGELAPVPGGAPGAARPSRRPGRPRAWPADLDGPGGTGSNGKQN